LDEVKEKIEVDENTKQKLNEILREELIHKSSDINATKVYYLIIIL